MIFSKNDPVHWNPEKLPLQSAASRSIEVYLLQKMSTVQASSNLLNEFGLSDMQTISASKLSADGEGPGNNRELSMYASRNSAQFQRKRPKTAKALAVILEIYSLKLNLLNPLLLLGL